ncbi:hypothetical protein F5X68DRAFT_278871 [Plectosphaerella plurivora]|uniref:Uncharacterized protein n=1 Tax=Plectosphaerella plurivora TaxID=936078 RepID=A0A9P9A868_9PEZI|nr:hypothetical protein F5X68DRAFT_278871 [Plectosphaerella plurivora]
MAPVNSDSAPAVNGRRFRIKRSPRKIIVRPEPISSESDDDDTKNSSDDSVSKGVAESSPSRKAPGAAKKTALESIVARPVASAVDAENASKDGSSGEDESESDSGSDDTSSSDSTSDSESNSDSDEVENEQQSVQTDQAREQARAVAAEALVSLSSANSTPGADDKVIAKINGALSKTQTPVASPGSDNAKTRNTRATATRKKAQPPVEMPPPSTQRATRSSSAVPNVNISKVATKLAETRKKAPAVVAAQLADISSASSSSSESSGDKDIAAPRQLRKRTPLPDAVAPNSRKSLPSSSNLATNGGKGAARKKAPAIVAAQLADVSSASSSSSESSGDKDVVESRQLRKRTPLVDAAPPSGQKPPPSSSAVNGSQVATRSRSPRKKTPAAVAPSVGDTSTSSESSESSESSADSSGDKSVVQSTETPSREDTPAVEAVAPSSSKTRPGSSSQTNGIKGLAKTTSPRKKAPAVEAATATDASSSESSGDKVVQEMSASQRRSQILAAAALAVLPRSVTPTAAPAASNRSGRDTEVVVAPPTPSEDDMEVDVQAGDVDDTSVDSKNDDSVNVDDPDATDVEDDDATDVENDTSADADDVQLVDAEDAQPNGRREESADLSMSQGSKYPATPRLATKRKATQNKSASTERPAKRRQVEPASSSRLREEVDESPSNTSRSAEDQLLEETAATPLQPSRQKSKPTFKQTPMGFKPRLARTPASAASSSKQTRKPLPASPNPKAARARRVTSTPRTPGSSSSASSLNAQEKKAILDAVNKWKRDHDLSSTELNDLVQERMPVGKPNWVEQPTVHKFWETVLRAASGRQRDTAIKHCRAMFHNFGSLSGKFTEQEDEEIVRLVETGGRNWAKWSVVLDRPATAIRKRYENYLICKDKKKTGPWSVPETELLIELVNDFTRDKGPDEKINWVQISKKMGGTRSRLQCLQKYSKLDTSSF